MREIKAETKPARSVTFVCSMIGNPYKAGASCRKKIVEIKPKMVRLVRKNMKDFFGFH